MHKGMVEKRYRDSKQRGADSLQIGKMRHKVEGKVMEA